MNMRLRAATVLLLTGLALSGTLHATERQPFSVLDLVTLHRVADPAVSPDGKRLTFTLRSTDLSANRGRTGLWLLDLTRRRAKPEPLMPDSGNDSAPQWSPDGTQLYFLSSRSGMRQIWRIPVTGGTAIQVTHFPVEVDSFRLSPRGDRLLLSAEVFADCADLECTAARLQRNAGHVASGILRTHLPVRHRGFSNDGRRSLLFSVAQDGGLLTGPVVNLTAGLDGDVPREPSAASEDYVFSPDGTQVVFGIQVAPTARPGAAAWTSNSDLYVVPAAGGPPRNLTASNPAADTQPRFSPDGSHLAYLATERPGDDSDRRRLMILDWKSGTVHPLTQDWDRSIDRFSWLPGGKTLVARARHLGQRPLWLIDAASGRASAISGSGTVGDFSVGNNRIVYASDDLASPPDLYAVAFTGGRVVRLTHVNPDLQSRRMGESEQFDFSGAQADRVFAYLVKPAQFRPGRTFPLAVLIHGGPHGSMANGWQWGWNAQGFAGAGYAVLLIDFHGSSGYGQAFTDSIQADWGGKPLEDIQKGIDAALARYRWLDGKHLCALGEGYGGYLVNWIAGNLPDRFSCLVSHAGVFDNRSLYYSTDRLAFPEWEFGGPEYANPAAYAHQNPMDHVKDWKTPMLVIHGGMDDRVPFAQGLAAFTALERRGIPAELLDFPDESHRITKPANSMQWYEVVIDWLNRWAGDSAATP